MVRDDITGIFEDSEHLRQVQYDGKAAAIDYLFRNFLKGRYDSIEDFTEKISATGIEIKNKNFFVAAASYEPWNTYSALELLEVFFAHSSDELEIFGDEGIENNKLIFVFAVGTNDEKQAKLALEELVKKISGQTGLVFYFGAGRICEDVSMINRSYRDADVALEYGVMKNKPMAFFGEISALEKYHDNYPADLVKKFEMALFKGDFDETEQELRALVDFMTQEEVPLFIVHALKSDLLRTIGRQSLSLGTNYEILPGDSKDMNEFYESISEQARKNCEYKSGRDVYENAKKLEAFQGYIDNNYLDANFSIKMMADEFNMSVSNLSHFFRKHAPENFSDYVQRKRIKKAKDLLAGDGMSINEVAQKSGYVNRTSFMKRFKLVTGMTAGEYREMLKKMDTKAGPGAE